MSWTVADIPDLNGKVVLVTGITGGLGREVATELSRHGATVLGSGRDLGRTTEAARAIAAQAAAGVVVPVGLDLADLSGVRNCARWLLGRHDRIDLMINNAGVMATPERTTIDGFELQIETNYLGHFALTGLLWPALTAASARVVSVSSLMHRTVKRIDLRTLERAGASPVRAYNRWRSYSESKLAGLMFARELDRRVLAGGLDVTSVAAHPGYAATGLQQAGPSLGSHPLERIALAIGNVTVAQSAREGALPLLMAATMPGLAGGSYIGPSSLGETRGAPQVVGMSAAARDEAAASDLWAASERVTGISYP